MTGGTPFLDPDSPTGRMVYAAKRLAPGPVWRAMTAPYWWWYNRGRHQLAGALSPLRKQSIRQLRALRDIHKGQRCFILGNGPSLRQMDLSPLKNEITFGLNRIYLLFPEMGFETSYFVAINSLVIEQCAEEIRQLGMPKFITWRGRKWLRQAPGVLFLDTDYTDPPTFSTDVSGRVFEGSTVTYVAMQIAFHMGFEEVILIGVDHSFSSKGKPNETVISAGEDTNHFSPRYFDRGFRWQLPDLEASERAYEMAKEAYERHGRRILDATVGGKLEVFHKVAYESLF